MKHTVKALQRKFVVVQPAEMPTFETPTPVICLEFHDGEPSSEPRRVYLTPDMCGALMFGLEVACETLDVRRAALVA